MKYFFIAFISLLAWSTTSQAQSSKVAFNQAANLFIEGQNQEALQSVNAGLQRHPNDAQLKALKEKLEQQQKEQQQQQQNQQEQQQEKGDSEKEKQEQQQQEGKENKEQKEEGEKKEQEGEQNQDEKKEEGEEQNEEQEPQEQPQPGESETEQRLKEMDISPEKARMILEAMKSNEVQYLQQKKRKASKRSNNGKPDW
jgi:hypothetical protein